MVIAIIINNDIFIMCSSVTVDSGSTSLIIPNEAECSGTYSGSNKVVIVRITFASTQQLAVGTTIAGTINMPTTAPLNNSGYSIFGTGCGYTGSAAVICNVQIANNSRNFTFTARVIGSAFGSQYNLSMTIPLILYKTVA